jgi:hypothetical protein
MDFPIEHARTAQLRVPVGRAPTIWLLAGVFAVATAFALALAWLVASTALAVETDPADATIFVNDQPAARAAAFHYGLGHGLGSLAWNLRVEAPGYLPWTGTAQLQPGGTTRVVARLAPMPGRLELDSNPGGATVRLDDEDVGTTPLVVDDLAPGRYRLSIAAADYERWDSQIEVAAGRTTSERIALTGRPTRLAVVSTGGSAQVWIDDQARGYVPLEVTLDPGEHLVRVEADGYRVWERRLALRPAESRVVDLALQQPWPDPTKEQFGVFAVMIENQEQARPQTGLDHASVVYEALAEGGITRFLALYAGQEPEVVGPVRSARHYYVNWAQEYNAPLVHVGASPQGYDALQSLHAPSLDEIRGDPGFWRSPTRVAPHNLFANLNNAKSILEQRRAVPPGSFGGLQFKRAAARIDGHPTTHAAITFGSWAYLAEWDYDPYWNEYTRWMDGAPHTDALTGAQLRATNVLIQTVESWPVPNDHEGRLDFAQVGKGRIIALLDGIAVDGTWSKSSLTAPTEYRDAKGAPLRLNTGPTWVVVVPPEGSVALTAD